MRTPPVAPLRPARRGPHPLFWCLLTLVAAGCPHRSPLWSPDGKRLLVLAGAKGEEVDQAASQLWLVEVEEGKAELLPPPSPGTRYLAALWLDPSRLAAFTGKWEDGDVVEGSEKIWERSLDRTTWSEIQGPVPSAARSTKRLPLRAERDGEPLLIYASDYEKVVALSLRSHKTLLELEPAELVGPGPGGGFLTYRPEASGSGATELVAFSSRLEPLWTARFSELRSQIAARLGRKPVEVVFNDTSTSHLSPAGGGEQWVGVTLIFSDVGWREGFSGFYARLDGKDGKVLGAVHGLGLPGMPAASGGVVWGVKAPEPKAGKPPALVALSLETGQEVRASPLGAERDSLHGYAVDPGGKRVALVVNGSPSEILLYDLAAAGTPQRIALK